MREAREEWSDEASRKKFREWHSMTNQFVIDAYEAVGVHCIEVTTLTPP